MRDDALRIADMLESLERIRGFVSGGRKSFFGELKTQVAVAYELLKLGEAASHLSPEFRRAHRSVPWRRLIEVRNQMVHEYFRVDLDSAWEFVEAELPGLERGLRTL